MSRPILKSAEYWLATRESGNQVVLHDGPHDSEEGVVKAKALYNRIFKADAEWAMVRISLVPKLAVKIDDEAVDACAEIIGRNQINRVRRGIPAPEHELTSEQEKMLAYLHGYPGDEAFGSK